MLNLTRAHVRHSSQAQEENAFNAHLFPAWTLELARSHWEVVWQEDDDLSNAWSKHDQEHAGSWCLAPQNSLLVAAKGKESRACTFTPAQEDEATVLRGRRKRGRRRMKVVLQIQSCRVECVRSRSLHLGSGIESSFSIIDKCLRKKQTPTILAILINFRCKVVFGERHSRHKWVRRRKIMSIQSYLDKQETARE